MYKDSSDKLNTFEGHIRKFIWRKFPADLFMFMTPQTLELFENFEIKADAVYIPNPVITDRIKVLAEQESEIDIVMKVNKFVAIGRLTRQKNYILLIEAIRNSDIRHNSIFYILGDGEQREYLQNKVNEYGLSGVVIFLGHILNPYCILSKCDAFIQVSLWEDPGHALIEAAFLNKILISSDCPNGPKEILREGRAGILFENNNLLALVSILNNFNSIRNMEFELPDINRFRLESYETNLINLLSQHNIN